MSFSTLEQVNFVFVRVETGDGLVGWGEAACLDGPTWGEESSGATSRPGWWAATPPSLPT
jgi:L-alanine-DL-glutamate epimerase-like enolase superfamily enzyme